MLAHQGGWDELLLVLGSMAVIVILLRLAKRRVERLQPTHRPDPPRDTDTDTEV